ncbi:hypothetical protein [uncultured Gammaproteobacteria bacterium]|nr:hypothetical protein [uncultured Gammaproteobacteria bacterium]CAC9452564.1 hypothetical protein [uncultured Gammaproteobacteria bacterium]SMN13354.1 hypothetical protein BHECKSOX2_417 [Bathymodiolus heckerae thiotrophic gill symbiont]
MLYYLKVNKRLISVYGNKPVVCCILTCTQKYLKNSLVGVFYTKQF